MYNYKNLIENLLAVKLEDFDPSKPLTVLWFGGGQDSTALLLMAKYNQGFKDKYCKENFVVVMSNTGNEFPETYQHIGRITSYCEENKIPFFFITHTMGFHTKTWLTLQTQMRKNNSIMSVVGRKSCTDSLKIQPCYKFLDHYIAKHYGFEYGYKRAIKAYANQFGKIKVIIGFAAGEEKRIAKNVDKRPLWMQRCIEYHYPLIDMGMDRTDCQVYIQDKKQFPVPMPSNCMFCMFQSQIEIVYLQRFLPEIWHEWVQLEKNKYKRDSLRGTPKDKNLGVKGNRTLPEFLEIAQAKFGHYTNKELEDYKFSHGHCVKSKY